MRRTCSRHLQRGRDSQLAWGGAGSHSRHANRICSVRLKHTALLTGPYDWDPALVPVQEYETRLAAVSQVLAKSSASGLIVHGNSSEYGALAYLTGFVPKLGPAFALVGRDTSVRLHVSGSPPMLAAAKRLTWQQDVRPVSDLSASIRDWMPEGLRGEQIQIGLWGSALALRAYRAIKVAIEPHGQIADLGGPLEALRLRNHPGNRPCCGRRAAFSTARPERCRALPWPEPGPVRRHWRRNARLFAAGAQDVRILASARHGGPPLCALDGPSDLVAEPVARLPPARALRRVLGRRLHDTFPIPTQSSGTCTGGSRRHAANRGTQL